MKNASFIFLGAIAIGFALFIAVQGVALAVPSINNIVFIPAEFVASIWRDYGFQPRGEIWFLLTPLLVIFEFFVVGLVISFCIWRRLNRWP